MVFYRGAEELIQKVRYYLGHDDERRRIAKAGYERTIKDHTYEKRFREIFSIIFK
jgi:spore maturation protein CgeB